MSKRMADPLRLVVNREAPLDWNKCIRQGHRWLSIAFTVTVVANFVAMGLGEPPAWVVYSPLPPLFLLLFSGLYMFVLPYTARWRSSRQQTVPTRAAS
jgi:cellulose synthase/poly-beta-1,6-N-acetylglucosamine synthase-like glycosyltransferase